MTRSPRQTRPTRPTRSSRSTPSGHTTRRRRAFTIIELVAVLFAALVIGLVVLALLPAIGAPHDRGRRMQDSTNVRGILQGMILFADANRGQYPLPSQFDAANLTIATEPGQEFTKNSTRNIFAILINQGLITTEQCVSPQEAGFFEEYEDYQFDEPDAVLQTGGDPFQALWDPAFRATSADEPLGPNRPDSVGSFSYAHALPFGQRVSQWTNSYIATEAVIANRGPVYTLKGAPATGEWTLYNDRGATPSIAGDQPLGKGSNTLLIHGNRTSWSGNIGYNDNHVAFENQPDPDAVVHTFSGITTPAQRDHPDNHFVNENDTTRDALDETAFAPRDFGQPGPAGADGRNAFLRLIVGGKGSITGDQTAPKVRFYYD